MPRGQSPPPPPPPRTSRPEAEDTFPEISIGPSARAGILRNGSSARRTGGGGGFGSGGRHGGDLRFAAGTASGGTGGGGGGGSGGRPGVGGEEKSFGTRTYFRSVTFRTLKGDGDGGATSFFPDLEKSCLMNLV